MSDKLSLVTGATGLLGSHIAEQLAGRGQRVRALVRPGNDTAFLAGLGVELVEGDLTDPASLAAAVAGVDTVYHCAGRTTDWGTWNLFQEAVIDATANLVEASKAAGVGRFLYVSSSRVYGRPKGAAPLTEETPLLQNLWWIWEYYPKAKLAAENLVRAFPGAWTIVRPTWIYGPRDRNTLPRIINTLKLGQARLVGSGENPLNLVYASDAADGVIRAATEPAAVGQVYNLSATETFTQRQFLDALADAAKQPRVTRRVSYTLAFTVGLMVESVGKLLGVKRNLRITRHGVSLLASALRYSSEKARKELGWVPTTPPLEGLQRTIEWYFSQGPGASAPVPAGTAA